MYTSHVRSLVRFGFRVPISLQVQINNVAVIRIQVFQAPILSGKKSPPRLADAANDGPLNGDNW